MRTVVATMDRW